MAAVVLVAMTGCKASPEKQIAELDSWSESFIQNYQDEITKMQADSTLSEAEREQNIEAYSDKATGEYKDKNLDLIKKNPSSPVAAKSLQLVYTMLDDAELAATVASLKGDAASDEFVAKLKTAIESKKGTAEGQHFTDFTVVQDEADPAASTVKFSDYVGNGKYVLVDFWASWCGPCKREIPNIAAVYQKYHGDDFDVLSVAVWDKPADTKAAAKEHGVVWNQIINAQRIPTDIYGIEGIPHIMLVGPDGTILKRDLRGSAIEEAVSKALGR